MCKVEEWSFIYDFWDIELYGLRVRVFLGIKPVLNALSFIKDLKFVVFASDFKFACVVRRLESQLKGDEHVVDSSFSLEISLIRNQY